MPKQYYIVVECVDGKGVTFAKSCNSQEEANDLAVARIKKLNREMDEEEVRDTLQEHGMYCDRGFDLTVLLEGAEADE